MNDLILLDNGDDVLIGEMTGATPAPPSTAPPVIETAAIGNKIGTDGNDTLVGVQNDTLVGGAGDDLLIARLGNNTLTGGLGQDIFQFAGLGSPRTFNVITDFDPLNDTIQIDLAGGQFSDLTTTQVGNDATISFNGTQLATVQNTLVAALSDILVVAGTDSPLNPIAALMPITAGLLQLTPSIGTSRLTVNKISHQATSRNELGVFAVDNIDGTVNGVTPGQSGYLAEVLKRSQVVFSALSGNAVDTALDGLNSRTINLPANSAFGFYLAVNGSIDDNPNPANVLFSFPSSTNSFQNAQITQPTNQAGITQIVFEETSGGGDRDFNDLVFQIQSATDAAPIGISQQGKREIFDLTAVATTAKATFTVQRDAGFNNHISFYKIDDAEGSIKVGNTTLKPGDAGYLQAAVQGRLAGIDIVGTNNQTVTSSGDFLGGALYAPLLFSNSATANADFSNVYTTYSLGNADKADHIRLLGDNTFGFEDLAGGGDRDFNDLIIKATFA